MPDLTLLPVCPVCSTPTAWSSTGHPCLCLRCTEREIGATAIDNALRIEAGLGWPAYWRRIEAYGLPWQTPTAWTS